MAYIPVIRYAIPTGVTVVEVGGQPALQYPLGGRVAVDSWVKDLWTQADGKTLAEILSQSQDEQDLLRAGLACLVRANLLARDELPPPTSPITSVSSGLVSAVIVAYEGIDWLKDCLPSLVNQNYSLIEIIIYDNASPTRDMQQWVEENYPQVRYLRGEKAVSFASANNIAIGHAQGDYLLLVNQDIRLDLRAVSELVQVAVQHPDCAAVAAKLRFWWAPSFLNGLGNVVLDHSWGMDIGFGSLDFGQLDHLQRLPSACFAVTLIPRPAWEKIGPIDAGFTMYYEDTEWCYRARAMGFGVHAAPNAVAYHAFGGRVPSGEAGGLSARKLGNACYGRLRFTLKLLYPPARSRYLANYLRDDLRDLLANAARLRIGNALAYFGAYFRLVKDLPGIMRLHKALGEHRDPSVDISALDFTPPDPLERNGLPLLTRAIVQGTYAPLLLLKRTMPMPEFSYRITPRQLAPGQQRYCRH